MFPPPQPPPPGGRGVGEGDPNSEFFFCKMQWVKLHCLVVLLCTTLVSLLIDASLPFFPIEISRIASSGRYAQQVFKWGITSILFSLVYEVINESGNETSQPCGWLVWLGVMIAAWYPDKHNFFIHSSGVVLIILAVLVHVVRKSQEYMAVFLLALFIQGLGLAIKGYVVWFIEFGNGKAYNPLSYVDALLSAPQIVQHGMEILFTTEFVQERMVHAKLSVACFQVSGVMQWMALYLMSCVF